MPISKHGTRKHVLRTSGACVNGKHTGPAKFKHPGQKKK